MKNFIFFAILLININYVSPLQAQENYTSEYQTMMTYISSYIWQNQIVDTIPSSSNDTAIIFDLDGVVLTTDKLQAFQEIGMATILQYVATNWQLPSQARLFQILESVPAESKFQAYNQGILMPQIMVDWQCSSQSLLSIQLAMNRHIKNSAISDAEKNLLLQTTAMMTNPEKFIKTRKTIPAGVALLHELKKAGYKLYVLSNWDAASFSLLQKKFPEIFIHNHENMFDGIMISGKIGTLKPERSMFEKCLTEFNITPAHAIFIDDTIENIQAADNLEMNTIHCNPQDIAPVRNKLIKILSK